MRKLFAGRRFAGRTNFTYLTGKLPSEPTFQSDEYLPKVAPPPVFVIQSSNDK